MPAVATLKWSGPISGKDADGNTAATLWDVVGAVDCDDALAASGVANINDAFKAGDIRKCKSVFARQVSVGFYEVTAQYAVPPTGAWTAQDTTNPLNDPPTILWQTVIETDVFDRDIDGYPVVNPAGDAFSNPPTRTYTHKILKITKNRSFYNYQTLKQYENTVNDAVVTTTEPNGQVVSFPAGSMKCVSIEPAQAYRSNDKFVPVCATFEIFEKTDGVTTDHPHQARILAQGANGWYSDNGTVRPGAICTENGDQVTSEKRLKKDGTPLDNRYKIKDGAKTPSAAVANPTLVSWATYEETADACFSIFKRYKKTSFSALFTAMGI